MRGVCGGGGGNQACIIHEAGSTASGCLVGAHHEQLATI